MKKQLLLNAVVTLTVLSSLAAMGEVLKIYQLAAMAGVGLGEAFGPMVESALLGFAQTFIVGGIATAIFGGALLGIVCGAKALFGIGKNNASK